MWYTDLVALTDRVMHRQFKDLLSDAGLTPLSFRDAVEHLTGERISRDRSLRPFVEDQKRAGGDQGEAQRVIPS